LNDIWTHPASRDEVYSV